SADHVMSDLHDYRVQLVSCSPNGGPCDALDPALEKFYREHRTTGHPLPARGKDMGNEVGIDMGNSFHFIFPPFEGHVMEGPYSSGATAAVREVGLEGPTKHVAIVSVVSNQPQVRLQMEASLRTRRSAGVVGSAPSSWSLASANEREMVEANSPDAAAPLELGKSQTASSLGQGVQRATRPGGAHDWRVAQKTQTQSPRSSTFSPRAAAEPWRVDGGCSKQSSMDGGFQR